MKKLIILTLFLILIAMSLAYADLTENIFTNSTLIYNPYNISWNNATLATSPHAGIVTGTPALNTTVWRTNSSATYFNGNSRIQYFDDNRALQNFTVYMWVNCTDVQTAMLMGMGGFVGSGYDGDWYVGIVAGDNTFRCGIGSADTDTKATVPQSAICNGDWHFLTCVYNRTGAAEHSITMYWNGTQRPNGSTTHGAAWGDTGTNSTNLTIGADSFTITQGYTGFLDEVGLVNYSMPHSQILHLYNLTFNGSQVQKGPEPIIDTAPPAINNNSYNMTSDGGEGCINWRINKNNPCSTSDITPTVEFTTNESASCAIGTQDINFSSYNVLGIDRNCTIGQGTASHTCTLVSEDELVYDTSYIYISCEDSIKNQGNSSTSGALKVSITGLENARRDSIGLGIQNALLSGYTNYTDLQIAARNLSNNQVKGTFDRAAKKGNKMWAFNGIGVSDSYVNMFNLTPVLYNFEFANKTSEYITNQTERLINATR